MLCKQPFPMDFFRPFSHIYISPFYLRSSAHPVWLSLFCCYHEKTKALLTLQVFSYVISISSSRYRRDLYLYQYGLHFNLIPFRQNGVSFCDSWHRFPISKVTKTTCTARDTRDLICSQRSLINPELMSHSYTHTSKFNRINILFIELLSF